MPFVLFYFDIAGFRSNFKHYSEGQLRDLYAFIYGDLINLDTKDAKEGHSKPLGKGLFELRFQKNPDLLARVFWAYGRGQEIYILDGYDKKRDSSKLTQQRHISRSRSRLDTLRSEE